MRRVLLRVILVMALLTLLVVPSNLSISAYYALDPRPAGKLGALEGFESLPAGLSRHQTIAVKNRHYALGGRGGPGSAAQNQYYLDPDATDLEWLTSLFDLNSLTRAHGAGITGRATENKSYTLGAIGSLTGFPSGGIPQRAVFQYVVDDLNKDLAKQGIEIVLDYRDGGCSATVAATTFKQMKDEDIDIFIGPVCSTAAAGILTPPLHSSPSKGVWKNRNEFSDALETTAILSATTASATLEGLTQDLGLTPLPYHSNTWSTTVTGGPIGSILCDEASKIGMITEDDVSAKGVLKGARDFINANCPGDLVSDNVIAITQSNVESVLRNLRSLGTDGVFLNLFPTPASVMIDALRVVFAEDSSWSPQLVGTFAFDNPTVAAEGADVLEGMIVVNVLNPPSTQNGFNGYYNKMKKALGDTIADDHETAMGGTHYSMSAVDTVTMMVDLMVEFDGNPKAIKEALDTRVFEGFLGTLFFGGKVFVRHADGPPIITVATSIISSGVLSDPEPL